MNPISKGIALGYTGQQLLNFLSKAIPSLSPKINQAQKAGHTIESILSFIGKTMEAQSYPKNMTQNQIHGQKTQQKEEFTKGLLAKGAALLGTGLATAALSRSLPKLASGLMQQGATLQAPNQLGNPAQTSTTLQTPIQTQTLKQQQQPQATNIPKPSPIQPETSQAILANPSSQQPPVNNLLSPSITENPQNIKAEGIPLQSISPLPEALKQQTQAMLEAGNPIENIAGTLKTTQKNIVKEYEKATNQPIERAIEDFAKSNPVQGRKPESMAPALHPETPIEKPQDISIIGGMAKGMTDNFYDGVFKSLKERKETFSGVKEPLIQRAKKAFDEGLIKSPEDLRAFANGKLHEKANKLVALPDGTIGEIGNIRQGIAEVNTEAGLKRRKLGELIESPLPEKDLADLHDELLKGIESKTGEEISRMVSFAGYDPKTNELAFLPHMGALYVYDNISPEDAKQLTSILSKRKTSGENFMGAWTKDTKSPIGAEMSKLIQKLQKERGGKGSEYKGKYEKIYDAIEPAKVEAKEKLQEKKKKEKENVKKRKAKKPGSNQNPLFP